MPRASLSFDDLTPRHPTRDEQWERRVRVVGLAICNAQRAYHMLNKIEKWDELTDDAQEHFRLMASAALDALRQD